MQQKEQKVSPIKQRILQFVDSLGITKRDFYTKTAISRGTLESATGITEDTLTKFIATYQNVSPLWVLTGQGDMLIKSNNTDLLNTYNDCGDQEQCNVSDIDTSYNTQVNTPMRKQVPFYNLPVSAGPLGVLNMDYIKTHTPDGYSELPLFDGCETILPVIGLSMDPIVRPGDYIGIKRVNTPNGDLSFVVTGQVYLIITREDRMIKYIEDCEDENYIVAKSHNHKPFKILKQDILEVHLVKVVAKNLM